MQADGPHADMFETAKITGSVGRAPAESLEDIELREEAARMNRYAQLLQPTLSIVYPEIVSIRQRVVDLSLRIVDLERAQQRNTLLQTFVLIVTCGLFLVISYLKK